MWQIGAIYSGDGGLRAQYYNAVAIFLEVFEGTLVHSIPVGF